MSKLSFFVPDDLHINERNYPSFYKFVAKHSHRLHLDGGRRDWVALYGHYESKQEALAKQVAMFENMTADAMFAYHCHGINLFAISRAEILALVSPRVHWYNSAYPTTVRAVFDKLFMHDHRILVLNLAAAENWILYFKRLLNDFKPFTHCCVFSGSLIYQRAACEVFRHTPTKVMVMESFFTGNEYYCEEKYGHIANNCDIRHPAVYQATRTQTNPNEADRERIKAINKVLLAKNKNVTQPLPSEPIVFDDPKAPTVTILGQVINDFSVLEYLGTGMSTVHFYQSLIEALVSRGINVVFKAHPWEEKKIHVRQPLTRSLIESFAATLPPEQAARVRVVDHYNLRQLLQQSHYVAALNSQGALEAAFEGCKVAQFGDAFYGRKGFTHDFSLSCIDRFADGVANGTIEGQMGLPEFRACEDFLVRMLQYKLITVRDSGVAQLEALFKPAATVPLLTEHSIKAAREALQAKEAAKRAQARTALAKPTVAAPKAAPVAPSNVNAAPARATPPQATVAAKPRSKLKAKMRKLRTDPRAFFRDSNIRFVRSVRLLFTNKV